MYGTTVRLSSRCSARASADFAPVRFTFRLATSTSAPNRLSGARSSGPTPALSRSALRASLAVGLTHSGFDAQLEKAAFHRVAGQRGGGLKMVSCALHVPGLQLQLAERCR